MSESPKLWRIIGRRTFVDEDSNIQLMEHEFIVEGDTLNEVLQRHNRLLSEYEYINATAVV